ncbi:MAG: ribbon-helix-helix protein, CopG family [Acidobacteria bacterium]|nr:ribbon-helix-helix protein, CopG family [Acidobacteriota bacterium]
MNLTISVEEELLERARELARRRGISLQELIRDQLRLLAGERTGADVADELLELMQTSGGRSGGLRLSRHEAYEDRV